ncbi:MAG: tRNA (adenosine(37)-N6)-dimethylallyltransferase MiaA [Myxococcales bacterium]|nr:tRNA (adenosine(37)-N6)-dimethylallyltransferase MiaA [Myxococcales bacterium]
MNEIFSRKRQPIVVGGSGLYIRALVDGLSEPKVADQELKANLKQEAKEKGLEVLYERLQVADPVTAEKLHSNDSQRIMRALEVTDLTEEPYSKFLAATPRPAEFEPVFIGLHMDRSKLYERIERRVDLMLKQGLLGEVKNLQALGYDSDLNALQSVGYHEAIEFIAKELTYSEMVTLIKQKTRNYAKRQMTWFRKDKRINWIAIDDETELTELAEEIINLGSSEN